MAAEAAIDAVTSDADVWQLVLDQLPLRDIRRCASTCRAHRTLGKALYGNVRLQR